MENPLALAILGGGTSVSIVHLLIRKVMVLPSVLWFFLSRRFLTFFTLKEDYDTSPNKNVGGVGNEYKIVNMHNWLLGLGNYVIDNNVRTAYNRNEPNLHKEVDSGIYYILKYLKNDGVFIKVSVSYTEKDSKSFMAKSEMVRFVVIVYGLKRHREAFIENLESTINTVRITPPDHGINPDDLLYIADLSYPLPGKFAGADSLLHNKRRLDTVFMDAKIKNTFKDHIINFMNNRYFYDSLNLKYKTGVLLYGPPGTGKTSLIKAIASELDIPILVVTTPGEINSINTSTSHFFDGIREFLKESSRAEVKDSNGHLHLQSSVLCKFAYRPIIILYEEIDKIMEFKDVEVAAVGEDGYRKMSNSEVFSSFLQTLDGMRSPANVIHIATTNNYNMLNPALIRPGRFDLHLNIPSITKEYAEEMIKSLMPERDLSDYMNVDEEETINASELYNKLLHDRLKDLAN